MNATDLQTITDWVNYNYTWVASHKALLLTTWLTVVGGASHLAALTPSKNSSSIVAKLHGLFNTDLIYKFLHLLALNVGNAKVATPQATTQVDVGNLTPKQAVDAVKPA